MKANGFLYIKTPPAALLAAGGYCIQKLLFPVVPDVLDIVILFHDVDELVHSKPSVSGEIKGNTGKIPLFKFDEKIQFSTNSVITSQQLA